MGKAIRGPCQFCGQDRQLVKAHAIPEAFFRVMRSGGKLPLVMIARDPRQAPRRAPLGDYDREILCGECDGRLGKFDDYASTLLIRDRDTAFRTAMVSEGTEAIEYFVADDFDYARLKLFIVSVLWRAHVSQRPFFKQLHLGPRAARAKEMLTTSDAASPAEFATVWSRWVVPPGKKSEPKFSMSPTTRKLGHVREVRLYLGYFRAHVYVSKAGFPIALRDFVMAPGRPLIAISDDLLTSKDLGTFGPAIGRHGDARHDKTRR